MRGGVTIIELLVVIAIIGILSVVSVVTLGNAKSSRQVRIVADEIKDMVINARTYSVSPTISTDESVKTVRITLTKKIDDAKASINIAERNVDGTKVGLDITKEFPDNITFDYGNTRFTGEAVVSAIFDFDAGTVGQIGEIVDSNNLPTSDFYFIVQNITGTEKYKMVVNRFGQTRIIKITPAPVSGGGYTDTYNQALVDNLFAQCFSPGLEVDSAGPGMGDGVIVPGTLACVDTRWPLLPAGYEATLSTGADYNFYTITIPLPNNTNYVCNKDGCGINE